MQSKDIIQVHDMIIYSSRVPFHVKSVSQSNWKIVTKSIELAWY